MTQSLPRGPQLIADAPSGRSSPTSPAMGAEHGEAQGQILDQQTSNHRIPSPGGQERSGGSQQAAAPYAFVLFAAIELAFVFGLLVLTKLSPSQVLQVTSGTTAISVAGFFGRNAIVTIGRRVITGAGQ
jgi:hypothetical protein